jgi:drug/metabolite transporter (DMT)-like permease
MDNERGKYMRYLLVGIYLILSISGLIFMKLGGNPGTIAVKDGNINMAMNLISGVGFVCYIGSFLLFTRIVVIFDLSYIFPICTGVVQIITLVASYYVFKEKISIYGLVGASLVIIGVIIMNIKIEDKGKIKSIDNASKIVQEVDSSAKKV